MCAVKLRRDRVVVVLATKVYVYRFSDLKLLDQIDTQPNPRGLVLPHRSTTCSRVPGVTRGHARVECMMRASPRSWRRTSRI